MRGKSSNQAWAARCAVDELAGRGGLDLDHLTITSCDADTQFPTQYFNCLTFKFATDPNRYARFWQAPIFFYNNIWQVPRPTRVPNALQGLVHLSRLSRKQRVLFSQSTYSLSMRMAHDVDYWDSDVIPEDWHMFLKCFYALGGTVEVEPIYLPIGNDGALSHGHKATFINQYLQVRRWAWGAVDIAYAAKETVKRRDIPLLSRIRRAWYVVENHVTWSTQWFFITLGGNVPWFIKVVFGHEIMPDYFTDFAAYHPHPMPPRLRRPHLLRRPPAAAGAGVVHPRPQGPGLRALAALARHQLLLLRPARARFSDQAYARPPHGVPGHREGLRHPHSEPSKAAQRHLLRYQRVDSTSWRLDDCEKRKRRRREGAFVRVAD